jgi:glycosyltransferase involved in cell wall biosynthesis
MTGKRHRIAHIMPWEGIGGTEQAALRIARTVEEAGFDTTFFCVRSAPVVRNFFASAGYDTVMWREGYPRFNGYRYFLHESLQLAREFRRRGITLVHCADVPAGSFAALAGRMALAPVICHVRNRHVEIPEQDRHLLRAVNRFAFVSRGAWRAFVHRVPESRGVVVYDGIEVPAEDTNDCREANRRDVAHEFNIPPGTTIVGMIARVDRQKDYETLAKAAARVVSVNPGVRFLIVGGHSVEDIQRRHFEQVKQWLAENRVSEYFIFTDFRSDVPRLLGAMDIMVLSTHYEGLPLVLLEAMARGKPVVATDVDGVPELVTDNQTGLLFPHQDDARLAEHIISLVNNPPYAARLGASGRSFVQSNFNDEQFKRAIVGLYESVLGSNPLAAAIRRGLVPAADIAVRLGYAAVDANVRAHDLSRSRRVSP